MSFQILRRVIESISVRPWVWLCLLAFGGCASSLRPVPEAWRSVPPAARMDLCAHAVCAPRPAAGEVKVVDGKLVAGTKELTPRFAAIDSFDVSLERREVVFSAKRKDNFDVGLVSLDGSDIHWVPEDPADETSVQWAPRGNKISFVVHTRGGDLVRTVHVPTATQLTTEFPYAQVRALAWEPAAERYAVVVASPDASERIESMKYGGEGRQTVVGPTVRLDVATEPVAGAALLMRPNALRYGERLPLVVWVSDEMFGWDDARGALMRNARVACAVVTAAPDEGFWKAVGAIPWIDSEKTYVVGAHASRGTSIVPSDAELPGYEVRGSDVVVPRAIIRSFAASWIAQQLKDRNGVR